MAGSSYPLAIKCVLAHEGGYTDHPKDPGGPTNWGITIADARKYWKPQATAADVKAMPLAIAQDIYRKRYWNAQRCDELPAGLDYSMFDYGVNSGIGRSGKVLRRLVGLPDNTSVVTDEVIAAVKKRDASSLIKALNDERLRFLQSLKTWPTFGKGWRRRVADVRALSLQMAGGMASASTPQPTVAGDAMAKGTVKPPPLGGVMAGSGTASVGSAAYGLDWIHAHPGLAVFAGIAAVVVTIVICEILMSRQQKKSETPMAGTIAVPVTA